MREDEIVENISESGSEYENAISEENDGQERRDTRDI